MKNETIGFVGGGRVVSILLGAWEHGASLPADIIVCDCNATTLNDLGARHPEILTTTDIGAACSRDIVFLAVHPPVVKEVVPGVARHLQREAILVSLAPKITIPVLSEMLGGFDRVVRMIPNAPAIVGKGFNPIAFSQAVDDECRKAVRHLLEPLGDCPLVPEEHLEAYAIVAAMGPTYFWPQLYELQTLAHSFGLSEADAMAAIETMLAGTLATMKDPGLSSEAVQDLIPVKPMADDMKALAASYRRKLNGLMEKIRP